MNSCAGARPSMASATRSKKCATVRRRDGDNFGALEYLQRLIDEKVERASALGEGHQQAAVALLGRWPPHRRWQRRRDATTKRGPFAGLGDSALCVDSWFSVSIGWLISLAASSLASLS